MILRVFIRELKWAWNSPRFDNRWRAVYYAWLVRNGRGASNAEQGKSQAPAAQ